MAGTKTITLFVILLLASPILFTPSCTSTPKQPEDLDDLASDDINHEAADVSTGGSTPHPKIANAWYTRTLVNTTPQPSPEAISRCQEDIRALSQNAGNQRDMIAASNSAVQLIRQNKQLYHWCFYQVMVNLDERLDMGGPLMSELADIFFYSTKNMWILATALDISYANSDGDEDDGESEDYADQDGQSQQQALSDNDELENEEIAGGRYFAYLRERYIQISRDYFGRNLVIVGRPMGNLPVIKTSVKPAGKLNYDD